MTDEDLAKLRELLLNLQPIVRKPKELFAIDEQDRAALYRALTELQGLKKESRYGASEDLRKRLRGEPFQLEVLQSPARREESLREMRRKSGQ